MYGAFAASTFQSQFAYRTQVWASLFGELVLVFARIAIWTSIFAAGANTGGIELVDMVTYTVIGGTLLFVWYPSDLIYPVGRALKSGDVAVYLLKPVHYPLYLLATELGRLAYQLLTIALPVLVIVALTVGIKAPPTLFHAGMFLAYWALGFGVLFASAAICSVLAFWMMTAFSLDWFLRAMLSLFSGTFIPFWFFPEPLAAFALHQPFAWIAYYPAAVYLGRLGVIDCWLMLCVGICWLTVLSLVVALLWRATARRLAIHGG